MKKSRLPFGVFLAIAGIGLGFLGWKFARSGSRVVARPPMERLQEVMHPVVSGAEKGVQEHIAEARRHLEASEKAGSTVGPQARAVAFGEMGSVYHTYRFEDAAAICYRNATRLKTNELVWFYLLGLVELKRGETEAGVAALRSAELLQRVPSGVRTDMRVAIGCWLGSGLVQLGQSASARERFESALVHDPRCVYAMAELGRLLLREGRHAEALGHLTEAARLVPRQTEVLRNLAAVQSALGRTNEAAQLDAGLTRRNERVAPLSPPDPSIEQRTQRDRSSISHVRRARELIKSERFAEAEPLLLKARELNATNRNAQALLAMAVDGLGRTEEARSMYESLRKTSEDDPDLTYRLARIYLDQPDRLQDALPLLEKLVKAIPDEPKFRTALGTALYRTGNPTEALVHFRESRRLAPSAMPAWVGEAEVLAARGERVAALSIFDEVRRQFPNSPVPDLARARFLIRVTSPSIRNPALALDLAQSANAARPSDDGFDTVALTLAANQRYAEAAAVQRGLIQRRGTALKPAERALLEANLARYERSELGVDRTWRSE